MNYNNKYATKFYNNMKSIIEKWEGYENSFYDNTIIPICNADPLLQHYLARGKDQFPHNLWLIWIYGPIDSNIQSLDELEQLYQKTQYKFTISDSRSAVQKGKDFEDVMAQRATSYYIMQKFAEALPGKLQHVGQINKREDFILTDEFSLDIKYSGLETDDRFKNIIKPWGNNWYSATLRIQEGILRSLYREGAQEGEWRPTATGQTKHHGIYDIKNNFEEVTQNMYDDHHFGPIPSLRKNIIYLYNDDGYWASTCLQKVTEWAANRIEETGFTDWTGSPNYKSWDPYQFWKFTQKDWATRQTWYGKTI